MSTTGRPSGASAREGSIGPTHSEVGWARGSVAERTLRRRWFWWTTVAEVTGFTVPATVGVVGAGLSGRWLVPAMMLAGAVEGGMLGWGQAHVLGPVLPRLDRTRYVAFTGAAASAAYLLGMAPSSLGARVQQWPVALDATLGVVGGVLLLASIGTAQWLELRRHLPGAGTWILSTAGRLIHRE